MKTFIYAALAAAALTVSTASFAQDATAPLTRAEVLADLAQLEQAGYRPAANDLHYPDDLQAAEARVHAHDHLPQTNIARGVASENGAS